MSKPVVLLVEDEAALAEIVGESLEAKGFSVTGAATCEAAATSYAQKKPDIIVLDVMLPDGSGFDLATQIRKTDLQTPILFLTSRSRPEDVVTGFELGGNDYLKKPFSIAELIVRIQALLGTNRLAIKSVATHLHAIGKYTFHYPAGILEYADSRIQLTSREADLLHLLLLQRNDTIERDIILAKLWNNTDYFSGRSLDVFITKLRRHLKQDPSIVLLNVRGKGYRLVY